jgi:hypothetical protein
LNIQDHSPKSHDRQEAIKALDLICDLFVVLIKTDRATAAKGNIAFSMIFVPTVLLCFSLLVDVPIIILPLLFYFGLWEDWQGCYPHDSIIDSDRPQVSID